VVDETAGWLEHERYLTELEADVRLFAGLVAEGDQAARVPSCPDWDLAELCRHQGMVHRWVTEVVRTGAQERLGFDALPDPVMPDDADGRADWLRRGGLAVAEELRKAGPDLRVWGWAWEQNTRFWGRRMAHETMVHRLDAELALGRAGKVPADLAADNIDELLHNAGAPAARVYRNRDRLRGEGDTLHVHCTDTHGEWLLSRTPEGFRYERGHAKADAALRGPAAQLMELLLNRHTSAVPNEVERLGDSAVIALWLDGLAFG
jgi:uncharacterized protein (TIGR03083 family)